jgi:hypothetical protein
MIVQKLKDFSKLYDPQIGVDDDRDDV